MKKLLFLALAVAGITSCKKDDNNGGGTTSGPQVTQASVAASFTAGTVTNNYTITDSTKTAALLKGWPVAAGANLFWDFSTAPTSNTFKDSIKVSDGIYSSASYMKGFNMNFLGIPLYLNRYYEVNSSSWLNLGYYLKDSLSLPIDTSGGKLFVPSQKPSQTPALINVNFPIGYNNTISQPSSKNTITTYVTGSFSFSGFPIVLNKEKLTATVDSKVDSKNISYGKLKLAGYADTLDVVVQKFVVTEKTTFSFPNNSTYDFGIDILLKNYGLKNGQETTTTTYRFWALNKGLVMRIEQNGQAFVRTGL